MLAAVLLGLMLAGATSLPAIAARRAVRRAGGAYRARRMAREGRTPSRPARQRRPRPGNGASSNRQPNRQPSRCDSCS